MNGDACYELLASNFVSFLTLLHHLVLLSVRGAMFFPSSFLPRDARLFPGGRDDKFLGYEDVDVPGGRRRASVWGWFEHENRGASSSSSSSSHAEVGYHKVYVSVRTGWPVREEQALYGEGGESSGVFVTAFVEFTFDHARLSSESRGAAASAVTESRFLGVPEVEGSVFALPESCSVVRATMRSPAGGGGEL